MSQCVWREWGSSQGGHMGRGVKSYVTSKQDDHRAFSCHVQRVVIHPSSPQGRTKWGKGWTWVCKRVPVNSEAERIVGRTRSLKIAKQRACNALRRLVAAYSEW